jgi:hypothetical protein
MTRARIDIPAQIYLPEGVLPDPHATIDAVYEVTGFPELLVVGKGLGHEGVKFAFGQRVKRLLVNVDQAQVFHFFLRIAATGLWTPNSRLAPPKIDNRESPTSEFPFLRDQRPRNFGQRMAFSPAATP